MNKSVSVKRLYTLGDYRNISFEDVISDIPQDIALNPEAMQLISYLQLVDIELSFNRYKALVEKAGSEHAEDVLKFLEEERTETFDQLLKTLSGDKAGQDEKMKE